ncbi:23S ribosomal RNA methyltransferase Erm [Flexivirga meconopsidis]|uniref:23S ribosomal RNA methyltransferase Erm n=1 Tax=Flexivirga meconopsidis TaxID=2977121 RepID=UPI00224043AA|nr:rRNA adenine N-6-methyltransferase family protein [Flexivirga meconopsidis]
MSRNTFRPGRHELGQNDLIDRRVIREVVDLVRDRSLPLVEWAGGGGALSVPLAALGRPLEVVELDPRRVAVLRRRLGPHVCVRCGDILRHAPPAPSYDLVCNVPFHLTTAVLRRMLGLDGWARSVLITQWEVARKRAGVGGATQLTAQWWPWFDFQLHQKISARAFRPVPSVDAGLLVMDRRTEPLVPTAERAAYQQWVRAIFTGRGAGLPEVLARSSDIPRTRLAPWCREQRIGPRDTPGRLSAQQWATLWQLRAQRPTHRD